MHFTITVDNGLTMSQCLHSLEIEIKIKRLQLCGRKRTTSKFIIGFGGIPNHKLKEHTDVLIKSLTV